MYSNDESSWVCGLPIKQDDCDIKNIKLEVKEDYIQLLDYTNTGGSKYELEYSQNQVKSEKIKEEFDDVVPFVVESGITPNKSEQVVSSEILEYHSVNVKKNYDSDGNFICIDDQKKSCQHCGLRLVNELDLNNHLTTCGPVNLWQCNYEMPIDANGIDNTIITTTRPNLGPKLYSCSQCDYRAKRKEHLNRHFKSKHDPNAEVYNCTVCDYTTRIKENIAVHFRYRHDEEAVWYKCSRCVYVTKRRGNLLMHFRYKHDSTEPYKCTHCDYSTKNKQSLGIHFRSRHNDEVGQFKCEDCGYTSKRKVALTKHVQRTHNLDLYKCLQCKYTTKTKCDLKLHCKWQHDKNSELHRCGYCNYSTKIRNKLSLHFKYNHDEEAEVFKCTQCDYATKRKEHFDRHFKCRHDVNAVMYNCEYCDYTGKRKDNLVKHLKRKHAEYQISSTLIPPLIGHIC